MAHNVSPGTTVYVRGGGGGGGGGGAGSAATCSTGAAAAGSGTGLTLYFSSLGRLNQPSPGLGLSDLPGAATGSGGGGSFVSVFDDQTASSPFAYRTRF